MTTWSCGHHDSVGAVCGDQAQGVLAPDHGCENGHHFSHWSPLTLWRCNYTNYSLSKEDCGDQRLGAELPKAPCRDRHDGWWVRIDRFDSGTAAIRKPITPEESAPVASTTPPTPGASRERMPEQRAGFTRRFRLKYTHKDGSVDEMRIYFTANVRDDGRLGEVFVKADRTGTLASGALDAAATMVSLLLQYGVPLEVVTSKLRHTRFGPGGFTGDAEFPSCSSPLDLLAQWLDRRWGTPR